MSQAKSASRYQSWGRYPAATHRNVSQVSWEDQLSQLLRQAEDASLLPFGLGRSYGDSCLNDGRDLLDCSQLNRVRDFDWDTGLVRVEAGMSLADLLQIIVPHGWFLPVTPGTKFVTIGGAIANDVHGKNHHRAGTFGLHVERMLIYRSDQGAVECTPMEREDLYRATIGGLGLTGIVAWADVRLKRIRGNTISAEFLPFQGLEEFRALSNASDNSFEYTVAWIDCLSGTHLRGIFFRGNHHDANLSSARRNYSVPIELPDILLNQGTVGLLNRAYYRLHAGRSGQSVMHYDAFFYPLDSVLNWNRIYGKRGMVQYQCVVPHEQIEIFTQMIEMVSHSGHSCFLSVVKQFGGVKSPGMLSFPRPGFTLALDLPMLGTSTLKLFDRLDEVILAAGGALYPAKDSHMSKPMFQSAFPNFREFGSFIDPKLSSSFWRRVNH